MGSKFEFSRLKGGKVCPICGHTDWCAICTPHDDMSATIYSCQRAGSMEPLTRYTSPYDGQEYVIVADRTATRSSVLCQELNEWMAKHPGRKLKDGTTAPGNNSGYQFQQKQYRHEESVELLPPDKLNEIYRAFIGELVLEDKHREYLYSEGFTDELIEAHGIRSIPDYDNFKFQERENGRIKKAASRTRKQIMYSLYQKFGNAIAGTPGFYVKDNAWTFNGPAGLIIPVPDIYGRYVGMRIRVDKRWKNAKGYNISKEQFYAEKAAAEAQGLKYLGNESGKYVWMSSFRQDETKYQQGIIANAYKYGVAVQSQIGYYYPITTGAKQGHEAVFVTEGEKKSIIASEKLGMMCIDIPGVGLWSKLFDKDDRGMRPIDILKRSGIRMVVVAYDADKENNMNVLRHQNNLATTLKGEGILTAIADWPIEKGKGLDDLLVNGYKSLMHYELIK